MTDRTTYLAPGFFVTLGDKRQGFLFAQLDGRLRRATPARLDAIDHLNRGFEGDLDELIVEVSRFDGQRPAIKHFLDALQAAGHLNSTAGHLSGTAGHLTSTLPTVRCAEVPAEVPGTVMAGEMTIATPVSLLTQAGQYLWYDHQGTLLLRLKLPELIALTIFSEPIDVESGRTMYLAQNNIDGLDAGEFDVLLARLAGAGLLTPARPRDNFEETPLFGTVNPAEVQGMIDARVAAHDELVASTGKELIQVVPVNTQAGMAPASLGLVMAYAMKYDGGRLLDKFDFIPMFLIDESRAVERAMAPSVFIFSNYLWTVEINLKISAAVKAMNPNNITVHGGPSTPSYAHDCEKFFADNPHVDIAVRGEGELTFAELLDSLDPANTRNLDVLRDIEGLTYRSADGVTRTGDRERIADLNTIPSPYLMGLFDEFGSVKAGAIIESNRGCPYGCTFCDWGSATLSRVRKFDLDRVFAELEWSARHQIEDASVADANFGMLERDVAITEKIAELKRTYGYPRTLSINYAKNQVKYLRKIIQIMADVEILTEGKVSLQTMDETTLKVIDRSNIKLDKYNELSTEFRRARLPLAVEIMIGLPGATAKAFRKDLQECTDRDIRVMLNTTTLLPNSPMNEPGYRQKHGIVALPGEVLKQTATYTRQEWDEMADLKTAYYLLDSYCLLRYVARYVRRETGMGEVEFYDNLQSEILRHPEEWPVIATALRTLEAYMGPPGSWGLFINEVRRYLVEHMGMPEDSGLRTTLVVQLAHLPAAGRKFPIVLQLEHDYVAWWENHLTVREEGHRTDWEKHIPRLSEYGPGTLTIDDPNEICHREIGKPLFLLLHNLRTWELDSPVARPRVGATFA